jgi:Ca2+:H+ antiporter
MRFLLKEIRDNPLLWLLIFLPALVAAQVLMPELPTLHFVLSLLAIAPLAVLISRAIEAIAARTNDVIGSLLIVTSGNLIELLIVIAALHSGQYVFVKAAIAGAVVTKVLFILGASFLLGGIKHHVQTYNRNGARLQAGLLFLATIALLIPSVVAQTHAAEATKEFNQVLSVGFSAALIAAYGLSLLFSLKTHRELFVGAGHTKPEEMPWPLSLALVVLIGAIILVAYVSGVFVGSVNHAAVAFGMTPAFIGFIVVSLLASVPEIVSALSMARRDRLNLSVGIALGGACQIALFTAPVLVLLSYIVGPSPMNLQFWPGAVVMILITTVTAFLVTSDGRSAWFIGVLVLIVYLFFATTLYLLPSPVQ